MGVLEGAGRYESTTRRSKKRQEAYGVQQSYDCTVIQRLEGIKYIWRQKYLIDGQGSKHPREFRFMGSKSRPSWSCGNENLKLMLPLN